MTSLHSRLAFIKPAYTITNLNSYDVIIALCFSACVNFFLELFFLIAYVDLLTTDNDFGDVC